MSIQKLSTPEDNVKYQIESILQKWLTPGLSFMAANF